MTEVTVRTVPVRPRELTVEELHGLDGLRAALAEVVDRTQPRAISWFWDRTCAEHDGAPAPAGFVESVAAAVGDLLAIHLPDVHWAVWPGPEGPTLGVASGARPLAPVLPFLDAQDRWRAGDRDWLHDYLARAAAHLVAAPAPRVPSQRQASGSLFRVADVPMPVVDVPAPVAEAPMPVVDVPVPVADVSAPVTDLPVPVADLPVPHGADPEVFHPQAVDDEATARESYVPQTPDEQVFAPQAPVEQAPASQQHASPEDDEPTGRSASDVPLELFARDTLEHAMSLLRDTGPFDGEVLVVLAGAGGRRTDLCSGEPEEALRRARDLVRGSGTRRAAVVWVERNPAGLPGPPQRFPALVVDAWDGEAESVRVAHRFVDDVLGTDPIGDLLMVGAAQPLR